MSGEGGGKGESGYVWVLRVLTDVPQCVCVGGGREGRGKNEGRQNRGVEGVGAC